LRGRRGESEFTDGSFTKYGKAYADVGKVLENGFSTKTTSPARRNVHDSNGKLIHLIVDRILANYHIENAHRTISKVENGYNDGSDV
jgi:hypothetical protein